jgi:dimethylargininase
MIALTHVPSPNLQACERTYVPHAAIDHARALAQHAEYCRVLRECGAEVKTLDVSPELADSVFIEDTAIVLDEVAIMCSMGAASRRQEPSRIEPILRNYRDVVRIEWPATIDGGDVLRIGRKLLVGQSCRTNSAGITALAEIARPLGHVVEAIPVRSCLHLKTACTALPDGRLLVNPAWIDECALQDYQQIPVKTEEPWGANVALLGSKVLIAAGHRRTADLVEGLGFLARRIDLSEFAKAEGGVTCLSLLIS